VCDFALPGRSALNQIAVRLFGAGPLAGSTGLRVRPFAESEIRMTDLITATFATCREADLVVERLV